ncbi:MAG: pyridoxamine 5'-phosphate oxidase [Bacteroidota bacterium]
MQNANDIANLRKEYKKHSLHETEVRSHPIKQFDMWFKEILEVTELEANAMTLATSVEGQPSSRIVLLKGFDERGFVFYTNYQSRKSREMLANPKASLQFFWPELERQIRIEGEVRKVSEDESDVYYGKRDRGSQIGAWSSPQSEVLHSREELERIVAHYSEEFKEMETIPRPEYWGGWRLKPHRMEFWQGRPSRLHDRILYSLEGEMWKIERLAP